MCGQFPPEKWKNQQINKFASHILANLGHPRLSSVACRRNILAKHFHILSTWGDYQSFWIFMIVKSFPNYV
jgi:hypothetical protein